MWIRAVVQVGAPAACLGGVLFGVRRTYLMTQQYHPFKAWGFTRHVVRYTWKLLTEGKEEARKYLQGTIKSTASPEDRPTSLRGLYHLFASFVLQSIGSLFWLIDGIWAQCH